eukprot:4484014-Amphidinium_carterae.1
MHCVEAFGKSTIWRFFKQCLAQIRMAAVPTIFVGKQTKLTETHRWQKGRGNLKEQAKMEI